MIPAANIDMPNTWEGDAMARRRYQQGTVFLRGKREKLWIGRWRSDEITAAGTIRRRRNSEVLGSLDDFPTKRLAMRALEQKLAAVNSRDYRPSATITFREFAEKWQATILVNHKPSTQCAARSQLRCHLVPRFGPVTLSAISSELVQGFVSSVATGPKSVRNLVAILKMIWKTARAWGYVQHDPFAAIVFPKLWTKEPACFTADQMRAIIELAEEPYKTFFWLAAETGMRVGELTGLRWEDAEGKQGDYCVVRVRQSVWRGRTCTTKTQRGNRTYIVSAALAEAIQDLHRGSSNDPTVQFVFATAQGNPWDQGAINRRLHSLLGQIGIPRAGMHAFRHGNETVMDRLNVPPKLRQQRLGHSDERMMMRYSHVASADEVNLSAKMGALFGPTLDPSSREAIDDKDMAA